MNLLINEFMFVLLLKGIKHWQQQTFISKFSKQWMLGQTEKARKEKKLEKSAQESIRIIIR